MGHVWYEISTDNGATWNLANSGKPLDNGTAKQPSIAPGYNSTIAIVYQQQTANNHYRIQLNGFYNDGNNYIRNLNHTVFDESTDLYTTDAAPVICREYNSTKIVVLWKNQNYLKYTSGILGINDYSSSFSNVDTQTLYSTDNTSDYQTMAFGNNYFYCAWQQHDAISNTNIYLKTIHFEWHSNGGGGDETGYWYTTQSTAQNISSGAGFGYNTQPSIIGYGTSARVLWLGRHYSIMPPVVVFTNLSNHYWNFGSGANTPNINSAEDGNFAFGWTEGSTIKFTDNTLSFVKSIPSISAQNVQISNGAGLNTMYAEGFNRASLPYYFQTTGNLESYIPESEGGSGLTKITQSNITTGREGVIYKDSLHFYFMLGDIMADGQPLEFVPVDDSLYITSKQQINQYTKSEPINVNDNTQFTYSVEFGVSDSLLGANFLGDSGYVNYKISMIDANNGEVLGVLEDINFTKENLNEYENCAYQIDMTGIGNRTVYLQLELNDNLEASYSLTDMIKEQEELSKTNYKKIDFNNGVEKITTYDLSQNFPNPFNPTTIINYQLPQTGHVTLKVYDILGKEVATLINEQKNQGRYSVNFNASNLASGVYIYRIKVNDYVSSKKMLMIK